MKKDQSLMNVSANRAHLKYYSKDLKSIFEEWLKDVLSPIWSNETYSLKPAKSVEMGKIDTPYPVHILNGYSTVLSLVDHAIKKDKQMPSDLKRVLRNVGLAFALHDYNKLTDEHGDMRSAKKILPELIKDLGYDELEYFPSTDTIIGLVIATEQGTISWEPDVDISLHDYDLEVDLLRAADKMSLQEVEMTSIENLSKLIKDVWSSVWGDEVKVNKIRYNSTPFYALNSVIDQVIRANVTQSLDRTLICSNRDGLLYFGPKIKSDEIESMVSQFEDYVINEIISPENTVKLGYWKFDMGAFEVLDAKQESLKNYFTQNIGSFIKVPNKKSGTDLNEIEGYDEAAESLNSILDEANLPLSLNLEKPNMDYEDEVLKRDEFEDFLLLAGILRTYQMLMNKKKAPEEFKEKWVKIFNDMAEKFKDKLEPLYNSGSMETKSYIFPIILAAKGHTNLNKLDDPKYDPSEEENLDPKNELEKLVSIINAIKKDKISDFKNVFEKIISIPESTRCMKLEIEKVPPKKDMCLATGGPATKRGITANLHGINRNTFTNRSNVNIRQSEGKVSNIFILESMIRKQISPSSNDDNPLVLFANTSCFVPAVNLGNILEKVDEDIEIENDQINVGGLDCSIKNDTALYTTLRRNDTIKDSFFVIRRALDLVKNTKLQVLVRTSNELIEGMPSHILDIQIPCPEFGEMGYNKISLKELSTVEKELNSFRDLSFKNNLADVISSFIHDPLYLFTLADKKARDDNRPITNYEPYMILYERGEKLKEMKRVAKAAYNVQKHSGESRTDRTWLFAEPIEEIIRNEIEGGNLKLEDAKPVIAGHLYQRALNRTDRRESESLEKQTYELADSIVEFIEDYWNGQIPDDERIRNATNTFQFMYQHICYNSGEWKYE